jgi:hypothetical protein
MLQTLWANRPGRRCVVGIRGKKVSHFWFDTTQEAMDKALELDGSGYNVFFSPALFDPSKVEARQAEINPKTGGHYTGREQAAVAALPALWLDMDCGEGKDYANQQEAAQTLAAWCQEGNVPLPTHVVSSGYGLHVYWRLDRPVPHKEWLPVAKHLKQACRVGGLSVDPARTSDAASLLRVPGTHNRKRDGAAEIRTLVDRDETVNLQAFRARLPLVGPIAAVPATPLGSEWDVSVKHPPGDAHRIADKCQQLGQFRFLKGAVPEPQWRAGLSILWRCRDGETLIHEWSAGDERYDAQEAEDKARRTDGPATCGHFSEVNPEGCTGCPHAGNVTSPIMLAYAEDVPEDVAEEDVIRVPGYTVTNEGIFMEPAAEGGPLTKIADFPIWIEEARELCSAHDQQLRSSLVLAWRDVRSNYHKVPLAQSELHDAKSWVTWLANNNLASFVKGPQLMNYISQMHRARFKKQGARVVYDCLGWYKDHSLFVLGAKGITKDGMEDVIVNSKDPIAELTPKGNLKDWLQGMGTLGKPQYRAHAFALLVGFAAPLLDLAGRNGAVVAFVGRSGFGKTLAARAALSIYADPEKIQESGLITHNALGKYLGQHRHIPTLVDEVTAMPDKRLRDLIYMAANGVEKSSLNQKREKVSAMSWRTVTMLTSNHSIVDRQQKDIEEAHRRRLVEVAVMNGVSREDGRRINAALQDNYGVAVEPYLQLVMKHKDVIPQLFDLVERQVESWGYSNAADRFGSWTCTAALLGGILARVAGVLPFDPMPVVKAVVEDAVSHSDEILSPEEQAHQALFELLTAESKRICVWQPGKLAVDDTDDPIARVRGDLLAVHSRELHAHWDSHYIFRKALSGWLDQVVVKRAKERLAPGVPPVHCYLFSLKALGWDYRTLKDD